MKQETLQTAIKVAEDFLAKAKVMLPLYGTAMFDYTPNKYRAAVRRASMDLTRVLADLRQGR